MTLPDRSAASPDGLRVYEALEGRGNVQHDGRLIANVYFRIKDVAETVTATSSDGATSDAVGQRTIYGIIRCAKAPLLAQYIGSRLSLHMSDGRVLQFTVVKHFNPTTCLIQGLTGFQ